MTFRFCFLVESVSASGSCRLVVEYVWVISFSVECIYLWLKWGGNMKSGACKVIVVVFLVEE
jgi:hypothetical protein